MVDAFGWQTTYQIVAGVVLFLCLSGLIDSPNVENDEVPNVVVEVDARASSASNPQNELVGHEGRAQTKTSVEEKKKGYSVYITVWKEPKFVAHGQHLS